MPETLESLRPARLSDILNLLGGKSLGINITYLMCVALVEDASGEPADALEQFAFREKLKRFREELERLAAG